MHTRQVDVFVLSVDLSRDMYQRVHDLFGIQQHLIQFVYMYDVRDHRQNSRRGATASKKGQRNVPPYRLQVTVVAGEYFC